MIRSLKHHYRKLVIGKHLRAIDHFKIYNRFRNYVERDRRIITASDGRTKVVGPRTMGKKIGQSKRKVAERTTTIKKRKTTTDTKK